MIAEFVSWSSRMYLSSRVVELFPFIAGVQQCLLYAIKPTELRALR